MDIDRHGQPIVFALLQRMHRCFSPSHSDPLHTVPRYLHVPHSFANLFHHLVYGAGFAEQFHAF